MYLRRVALYTLCFLSTSHAQEVIKSFDSTVNVHTDGSLSVYEKITVTSAQNQIKRGIVRTFPTRYRGWGIFNATVPFAVTTVKRNGFPSPYHLANSFTGRKIHLGDESFIKPGTHVYEIVYTTNRQLGFFKEHDELYWNGIGTEWEFPILHGSVTVKLPPAIPTETITAEAYTGRYGQQKQDYRITRSKNSITFTTTKPLGIHEGMTVVVTWPKGFIPEPSWIQKTIWFFQDNWAALWAFVWLLFALGLYLGTFIQSRRRKNASIIIPLFYPPKNMTPAEVMFLHKKEFRTESLGPEVVHAAVQGYLTIEYGEKSIGYTLTRTEKEPSLHSYNAGFISALFGSGSTVTLSQKDAARIINTEAFLKNHCTILYSHYIHEYTTLLNGAFACSIIAFVPAIAVNLISGFTTAIDIIDVLCLFAATGIYTLMLKSTRGYTPEGQPLADQIAGFKMFLETTETERLKIIGTPPTKTPELYEHYLPYAMALGVEEAWTRQFTPLFAKLADQGTPYRPRWYSGPRWNSYAFARGISSSIKTSLPRAPGRSSGSGGKGFSGGGGGGGGGRGR